MTAVALRHLQRGAVLFEQRYLLEDSTGAAPLLDHLPCSAAPSEPVAAYICRPNYPMMFQDE
jgi:hypothetical protein